VLVTDLSVLHFIKYRVYAKEWWGFKR